jgi:hypothetical protein
MIERIATVDGVDGGEIKCTIARVARGYAALGQYVMIESEDTQILARLNQIDLSNAVHDDLTFGPILAHSGCVPNWSGEVDVERSTLEVIGARDFEGKRTPFRINPASGTQILEASSEQIENFYNEKDKQCRVVIGTAPHSQGLPISIINRHFGAWEQGGYGEARHTGIFGQNGSGKTVHATELIGLKLIAHPRMGFLCPDTAGDISDPTRHDRGDFHWNYKDLMDAAGVSLEILPISEIRLLSKNTLIELLSPFFLKVLSTDGKCSNRLAEDITESLFPDRDIDSQSLTGNNIFAAMIPDGIERAFSQNLKKGKIQQAERLRDDAYSRKHFEGELNRIKKFFDGRERIDQLISSVLQGSRRVVIKMDLSAAVQEREQVFIMKEVFDHLARRARALYYGKQTCNALLAIDEASKWIPQGDRDSATGSIIENTLKETRKYGLGTMIISQRMVDVSKAVLAQAHMLWFGRGLGIGADRKHLEECLGKQGALAYDLLETDGGYFWVGMGQDNNLGSEGKYFAMYPFAGDVNKAVMEANPTLFP